MLYFCWSNFHAQCSCDLCQIGDSSLLNSILLNNKGMKITYMSLINVLTGNLSDELFSFDGIQWGCHLTFYLLFVQKMQFRSRSQESVSKTFCFKSQCWPKEYKTLEMVRCYQFVRLSITYYAQTLFQLIVSFVKSNLRVNDGKGLLDQGSFHKHRKNCECCPRHYEIKTWLKVHLIKVAFRGHITSSNTNLDQIHLQNLD